MEVALTKDQLRRVFANRNKIDSDTGKLFKGFVGSRRQPDDGLWHGDCLFEDPQPYQEEGLEFETFSLSTVLGLQSVDSVGYDGDRGEAATAETTDPIVGGLDDDSSGEA